MNCNEIMLSFGFDRDHMIRENSKYLSLVPMRVRNCELLEDVTCSSILYYDCLDTDYGPVFLSLINKKLCSLQFAHITLTEYLTILKKHYPGYSVVTNEAVTQEWLRDIFETKEVCLVLKGTSFQKAVWRQLLTILPGEVVSYTAVAQAIGFPTAQRAVANIIGNNPICYFVPCHRVIQKNGGLGGYRWGLALKKQLLTVEMGKTL